MRSDKGASAVRQYSAAFVWSCTALVVLLDQTASAQLIKVSKAEKSLPAGAVQFADAGSAGLFLSIRSEGQAKGGVFRIRSEARKLFDSNCSIAVTPANKIVIHESRRVYFAQPADVAHRAKWVERTPSFRRDDRKGEALFVSRQGHVYAANSNRIRIPNGMFQFLSRTTLAEDAFRMVADDSYGNLWGMTKTRGSVKLVVRNDEIFPGYFRSVDVRQQALAVEPKAICSGDLGHLWWSQGTRLVQFDPQTSTRGTVHLMPTESPITSLTRLADHQVLVGCEDGGVFRVHSDPKKFTATRIYKGNATIRGMHFDKFGVLWLVEGSRLLMSPSLQSDWHKNWIEEPRMPLGNHDHIFAQVGDRLYTAGGKTYAGWPASKWRNLDHIWSYNMKNGTWRVEAPMISPGKSYSGVGELDGELWLMGGYFRVGENGITATDEVEIYDPSTRQIRNGPKLPEPRGQVIGASIKGRLYAIGGASDKAPSPQVLSIGKGETAWRVETDAPKPISQASGCVLGDNVYIAGALGMLSYDVVTKSWTEFKRPGTSTSAPLCTSFKNRIWIMGGVSSGGKRTTQIFNPINSVWTNGPDIPLPVAWGAAAEVNGQLIIAGGAYFEPRIGRYYNSDRVFRLAR